MVKAIEASGEHVIAYAYPTSEDAVKHGHGKQGCYTVATRGICQPFVTLDQAKQATSAFGTVPGRWSIDHPLNSATR